MSGCGDKPSSGSVSGKEAEKLASRLPENYGIYLLTAAGWTKIKSAGENISWNTEVAQAITAPPQILFYSQKLTVVPMDFSKEGRWCKMVPVRDQVAEILDRNDRTKGMKRQKLEVWQPDKWNAGFEAKPIASRNDMVILTLPTAESNSRFLATVEDDTFAIEVGDAGKAPKMDQWITAVDDRGTWSNWLSASQGSSPMWNGLTVRQQGFYGVEKIEEWKSSLKSEFASLSSGAITEKAELVARTVDMDSELHQSLLGEFRQSLESFVAKPENQPVVIQAQILASVPEAMLSDELRAKKAAAKRAQSQIEEGIKQRLNDALAKSREKDTEYAKFKLWGGVGFQQTSRQLFLGKRYLAQVEKGLDPYQVWMGDVYQVKVDAPKKEHAGLAFEAERKIVTLYPVTLHLTDGNRMTLVFDSKEEAKTCLAAVVDALTEFRDEHKGGFETDFTAPIGFLSESIVVGRMGWSAFSIDPAERNIGFSVRVKNALDAEVIYPPGEQLPMSRSDDAVVALRVEGKSPVKARLVRMPVQIGDDVLQFLGRSAVAPAPPDGSQSEPRKADGSKLLETQPSGASVFSKGRLVGKTPLDVSKLESGPVVILLRGCYPLELPEPGLVTNSGGKLELKPLPIANWISDALKSSSATGLPTMSDRELHILTRLVAEFGLLNTAPERIRLHHSAQMKERQKWIEALREGNKAELKELAKTGLHSEHWEPAVKEVFASINGERGDAIWAFGHFDGFYQESIVKELCRRGNLVAAKHCAAAIRHDDRSYSQSMNHYAVAWVREGRGLSEEIKKWIDDPKDKGADAMALGGVVEALAEEGDFNAAVRLTDHAKFRSDSFQSSRKFAIHDIAKAMIAHGKIEDALKLIRQLPAKDRNGAVERNGFATVRALVKAGKHKEAEELLKECEIRPEERCLMLCDLAAHAATEVEARQFLTSAEALIPSIEPKAFLGMRGQWTWPEIARIYGSRFTDSDIKALQQRHTVWLEATKLTRSKANAQFEADLKAAANKGDPHPAFERDGDVFGNTLRANLVIGFATGAAAAGNISDAAALIESLPAEYFDPEAAFVVKKLLSGEGSDVYRHAAKQAFEAKRGDVVDQIMNSVLLSPPERAVWQILRNREKEAAAALGNIETLFKSANRRWLFVACENILYWSDPLFHVHSTWCLF